MSFKTKLNRNYPSQQKCHYLIQRQRNHKASTAVDEMIRICLWADRRLYHFVPVKEGKISLHTKLNISKCDSMKVWYYSAFEDINCQRTHELIIFSKLSLYNLHLGRSQWPRGLRRRFLAARLLRLWVRIPPGAWIFACCECCVLSGRGLCDGPTIRSEESYRLWRVVVCEQETS